MPEPDPALTTDFDDTIQPVVSTLVASIREIFGGRLISIYVYGSAVYGEFDPGVSDLDLTSVLTDDATESDLATLEAMHDRISATHPGWGHRIEVQYISLDALRSFRECRSRIANISPGEPLHFIEAGTDWLMNWYLITHFGRTLTGPEATTIFPEISDREFVESIREHASRLVGYVGTQTGSQDQSYPILTSCRALYTHRTGSHVSKARAAAWAAEAFPQWKPAIDDALLWRRSPPFDAPDTVGRTVAFVTEIAGIIERETNLDSRSSH
jgi:predicted nucleotidyltransferase